MQADPSTIPEHEQRIRFYVKHIMDMRTREERRRYLEGKVPDLYQDVVKKVVEANFMIRAAKKRWDAANG